ncbi:hypothetical protein [Pseudomarimonas arenosa]|uniref:Uncharacterized protein n=1 Tax=Pseudomarimonas arenosa TaxID=2774145 RepID=A0AAW3ZMY9_9GAMM|nr:hypothetical protein [Pseudomarimonas arenosa]MBD8526442.1 hypothetical protein [Pseudomarimonas arenosa]
MKKNSLSSAVVAGIAGVVGLAGVANAVNVNPDGLGQVLLYPYYSVNGSNTTLLSVVNTTNEGKAVKVRFLESLNSAEVLDFNLYMSPFDVWTASLSQIADVDGTSGGGALFTTDTTCTVPNAVGKDWVNGVPGASSTFKYFEFQSNNPDIIGTDNVIRIGGSGGALVASDPAERVRQGHFEVIEMGVLLDTATTFDPLTWATHTGPITARVPANCGALQAAWTTPSGTWIADDGVAINAPSGGLFGAATIVDVEFGRALPYNADAIAGFWSAIGLAAEANGTTDDLHAEPGDTFPNLSQARTESDGSATSRIFDDSGALVTLNFAGAQSGLRAVSSVLMSRYIYNEYSMETGLAAASEWVVTFPTKRLHTYNRLAADNRPFTDNTDDDPTALDDAEPFDSFGICETYTFARWDREEFTPGITSGPPVVSPRPPGVTAVFPELCWEANVIAFNQTLTNTSPTQVLGVTPVQGAHGLNINSGSNTFINGWARIEFNDPQTAGFDNYLVATTPTTAVIGLPVIGFWVADYTNENVAPGVRGNFGGIHKHRGDRDGFILTAPAPAFGTPLDSTGLATWTSSTP